MAESDTASKKSQRIILTRCIDEPQLIKEVRAHVGPEDFEEGTYRMVAEQVFAQFEKDGKTDPSAIISRFENKEDQTLAAEICETRIALSDISPEDRKKELADSIIRLLRDSLERKQYDAVARGDASAVMECVRRRKELEQLKKTIMK